jgi:D-alanine--poly(phosphoribitol) ligase subunit 1
MNYNLALPLYRHSIAHPARLALSADGLELSYGQLAAMAQRIAQWLGPRPGNKVARVGILASRSLEACAGVLGACWAGATYIPISLKAPEDRLLAVLELASLDAIVADAKGAQLLTPRALAAAPAKILVPDASRQAIGGLGQDRRVTGFSVLPPASAVEPESIDAGHVAYVIFTSGTTGVPKGVMISAASVEHYLAVIEERFKLTPEDSVSQASDLSFDASVTTMFMAWRVGASLHVVPDSQAIMPVRFIQEHRLTVWWSVPSIIAFVKRMKGFGPGVFPTLRYSMFGGEPLPVSAALAWQSAAPNGVIENSYGPTEVTIACIHHRIGDRPVVTPERDTVSIGDPLPGNEAAIVDADFKVLPPGERGELVLAGVQLAIGYLAAPELTARAFPVIDGKRWYRTGDLAYRDPEGRFHHLGRIDNQVKVLGNRVELEDIEAHLQAVCGTELAAAVAWPVSHGSAAGIIGFVAGTALSGAAIKEALKKRLPTYMVPGTIHVLRTMAMTANGKVDRKALVAMLDQGAGAQGKDDAAATIMPSTL